MSRAVLVDGDTFIFTATAANEYEVQWDDWMWTLHADMPACMEHLDRNLEAVLNDLQADKVIVAITDSVNWRKKIMPSYKHQRVKVRKPICYQAMRDYVMEKYVTYQRPGLEGDDILGILATHPKLIDADEKIIVSLDKDLQTIPGDLCNYGKVLKERESNPTLSFIESVRTVTAAEADRFHMLQTLAGDTTDGYPGCPGVGMVNAERLLDDGRVLEKTEHILKSGPRAGTTEERWVPGREGTPWEIVCSAYAKAGLSEAVALQNAQVARICRYTEYDFKQGEVVPWQPPRSAKD